MLDSLDCQLAVGDLVVYVTRMTKVGGSPYKNGGHLRRGRVQELYAGKNKDKVRVTVVDLLESDHRWTNIKKTVDPRTCLKVEG